MTLPGHLRHECSVINKTRSELNAAGRRQLSYTVSPVGPKPELATSHTKSTRGVVMMNPREPGNA